MSEVKENVPVQIGDKVMQMPELLAKLKGAQEGKTINTEYWTLKAVGETARFILTGFTKTKFNKNQKNVKQGEEVLTDVITILTEEGVSAICADVALVNLLKQQGKVNTAYQAVLKEMGKSGGGFEFKDYEVKELVL